MKTEVEIFLSQNLDFIEMKFRQKRRFIHCFHEKKRRKMIKILKSKFNLEYTFTEPSCVVSIVLGLIFISSLIAVFFDVFFLIPLLGSVLIYSTIAYFSKNLHDKTIGYFVKRAVEFNYLAFRRNPQTYNKKEAVNILEKMS